MVANSVHSTSIRSCPRQSIPARPLRSAPKDAPTIRTIPAIPLGCWPLVCSLRLSCRFTPPQYHPRQSPPLLPIHSCRFTPAGPCPSAPLLSHPLTSTPAVSLQLFNRRNHLSEVPPILSVTNFPRFKFRLCDPDRIHRCRRCRFHEVDV